MNLWEWLRRLVNPAFKAEQDVYRTFNPEALRRHPQAAEELKRIKLAEYQAKALMPAIYDAITAPTQSTAEKRFGSALKRTGSRSSTGTEMEGTGALARVLNSMQAPQRGAVMGAKALSQRLGIPGSKYGSAVDAYTDDAEWGALLEDVAPEMNVWARRLLAVPMDILLDPAIMLKPAKVVQWVGELQHILPKPWPTVVASIQTIAKSKLNEILNPTVYRIAQESYDLLDSKPRSITRRLAALARGLRAMLWAASQMPTPQGRLNMLKQVVSDYSKQFKQEIKHMADPETIEEIAKYRQHVDSRVNEALRRFGDSITNTLEASNVMPTNFIKEYLDHYWFELSDPRAMQLLEQILPSDLMDMMRQRASGYRRTYVDLATVRALEGVRRLIENSRPETFVEYLRRRLVNSPVGQAIGAPADRLARYLSGEPLDVVVGKKKWFPRLETQERFSPYLQPELIQRLERYSPIPIHPIYYAGPALMRGLLNNYYRWVLLARALKASRSNNDNR